MNDFTVFAERERTGWADTDIVGSYVEKFGPITNDVAKILVQRASAKGKDVLDLCCGQGALTAMLIEAGANTTGIDFSQEMLALAKTVASDAQSARDPGRFSGRIDHKIRAHFRAIRKIQEDDILAAANP